MTLYNFTLEERKLVNQMENEEQIRRLGIRTLETKVQNLENELADLKTRIEKLEAKK